MPKQEVTLTVDKVTKNAIRYREVDDTEKTFFPYIYIRKEALMLLAKACGKIERPDTIKVSVEVI